ncbi:hypothetical protein L596_029233 [Steinernema carpocapsae]|uniref:Uncharacterized protein n=1 Tax=Steinernema carpocapsae TaxID=34508 RepID=A0A4V5ZXF1_STECR|nr:hypothetical protein L596_029233 [Steinernema carpocapsae]
MSITSFPGVDEAAVSEAIAAERTLVLGASEGRRELVGKAQKKGLERNREQKGPEGRRRIKTTPTQHLNRAKRGASETRRGGGEEGREAFRLGDDWWKLRESEGETNEWRRFPRVPYDKSNWFLFKFDINECARTARFYLNDRKA